jgi:hypothetical protein
MAKSMTMADFEREWLLRGGTVVRDNAGHVTFKYPGLPAGAVHAPRSTGTDRTPRHLLSRLKKVQAGHVVTPPRVVEMPEPVVEKITRPRIVQRSVPQQHVRFAPYNPEPARATVQRIAEQKALERARVIDRIITREPQRDPLTRQLPTARGLDLRADAQYQRIRDERAPQIMGDIALDAFKASWHDGMVFIFGSVEEWKASIDPLCVPQAVAEMLPTARLQTGWIIAIVKNGQFPLRFNHTYGLPGDLALGDGPQHAVYLTVTTVTPALFARFRLSWERGFDQVEAECRAAGLLE